MNKKRLFKIVFNTMIVMLILYVPYMVYNHFDKTITILKLDNPNGCPKCHTYTVSKYCSKCGIKQPGTAVWTYCEKCNDTKTSCGYCGVCGTKTIQKAVKR